MEELAFDEIHSWISGWTSTREMYAAPFGTMLMHTSTNSHTRKHAHAHAQARTHSPTSHSCSHPHLPTYAYFQVEKLDFDEINSWISDWTSTRDMYAAPFGTENADLVDAVMEAYAKLADAYDTATSKCVSRVCVRVYLVCVCVCA